MVACSDGRGIFDVDPHCRKLDAFVAEYKIEADIYSEDLLPCPGPDLWKSACLLRSSTMAQAVSKRPWRCRVMKLFHPPEVYPQRRQFPDNWVSPTDARAFAQQLLDAAAGAEDVSKGGTGDIPVAIHMGTGGSGRANITSPKFRGSMGNPLLLEDLLARHPKLRVQVMHAGYPMIDNMLTLLQANSHVNVDIAGLIWSYPTKEVNRYIERLVDAGFEDRVMFGTDQMEWPKLMAYSISIIQNADYLTPEQKRDILYNNAARFYRLDNKSQH